MTYNSALWPPLWTRFQIASNGDDDPIAQMHFPDDITPSNVYTYVRSHMPGFAPVYYTEAYIAEVLEYVARNPIPFALELKAIWLKLFKQHFGCIACKRKFPHHTSELLRCRRCRRGN